MRSLGGCSGLGLGGSGGTHPPHPVLRAELTTTPIIVSPEPGGAGASSTNLTPDLGLLCPHLVNSGSA